MNSAILKELATRLSGLLPGGGGVLQADLQKNIGAVLQQTFQKFDLVSREEFEVQQAVLARTRAKVEALEQEVAALEHHDK